MPATPKPPKRKPVAVPLANDTRQALQAIDPNDSYKLTLRVPATVASEFKVEAARRMIPLQKLFELAFEAYKEKTN
jgi:hypothetical protein